MGMENNKFPLLPKLKKASSVKPAKANVWEGESFDFLNQLVKSLEISGNIGNNESIDSIPDVWARPLLFQMALFDKKSSDEGCLISGLSDRVRGEWRAVLAMLALKDVKHLNINAKIVHLDQEEGTIGEILYSLAPTWSIDSNMSWNDIYVIFYNEVPIALTTPSTLVVSAADYRSVFRGTLTEPWSHDGWILSDPIPYLTADDLSALYYWLENLQNELKREIPASKQQSNPICLDLFASIDSYMNDIKSVCRLSEKAIGLVDSGLDMTFGIFRHLNNTVIPKEATANESAVRLIPSAKRKPEKNVLLISTDMVRRYAEQQGLSATKLVIWPGISANDINDAALSQGKDSIGRVSLNNTEHCTPNSFFTDKIAVISSGSAFPGAMPVSGTESLSKKAMSAFLPFKKDLLTYYTADDIQQRVHLEYRGGNILVTFSFQLSGVDNSTAVYKASREYKAQEDEIIYIDTIRPSVDIWPSFQMDGWNKYYLFYCNDRDNEQEPASKQFFVMPWSNDYELNGCVPENGRLNRFTAKLPCFPEALYCIFNKSQVKDEQIDIGLLLLPTLPKPQRNIGRQWKVAIDFGTSSTMIYYRENDNTPQPMVFTPNIYQITNVESAAENRTHVYFIPTGQDGRQDGSFLSLYHMLNTNSLEKEVHPLTDGNIFLLESRTDTIDLFATHRNNIDSNIKWVTDEYGKRKVSAYIKQLCLQVLAEAATRGIDDIEWNFSYPVAFSKNQLASFSATCRTAVSDAYKDTGYTLNPEKITAWAESKASAFHFNKFGTSHTNFSEGAICLDIGAGTTDVSIISGQPGRIIHHTSLYYAGRYLFLPLMQEAIIQKVAGGAIDFSQTDMTDHNAVLTVLDAYMREHSDEYLRNLPNLTDNEEICSALQKTQVALAGIFYYLGLLLSELKIKGLYEENHVPDIFVGGNGLRIFNWITGGMFSSDNNSLCSLKRSIIDASGFESSTSFNIILSDTPKCEVANGMIAKPPQNAKEFFNEDEQRQRLFGDDIDDDYILGGMIAGNEFDLHGKTLTKDTFISARDISMGIKVNSLIELENFLECVDKERRNNWISHFSISSEKLMQIRKQVNSFYVSEIGKDPSEIIVEPVFIVAMKKLVEMLCNE